jgi:hypothetical protein
LNFQRGRCDVLSFDWAEVGMVRSVSECRSLSSVNAINTLKERYEQICLTNGEVEDVLARECCIWRIYSVADEKYLRRYATTAPNIFRVFYLCNPDITPLGNFRKVFGGDGPEEADQLDQLQKGCAYVVPAASFGVARCGN